MQTLHGRDRPYQSSRCLPDSGCVWTHASTREHQLSRWPSLVAT